MTQVLTPDICVIGAGSGGLSVAAAVAAFGVPVVLIEKGKMGGECLNNGCVPSKALLAAAKHAQTFRRANAFGIAPREPEIEFSKVHDHVQAVIAAIAPIDSKARFTGLGVRVIEGAARFKDPDTVVVDDIEIKARRFVIATGSSPALPFIPGLADAPHLTNETVFELTECPEHLLIIGGGPIGLEMAQAFRRLGAKATVFEAAHPFAKDDPECAEIVLQQLKREGIVIRAGAKIARVERAGSRLRIVLETDKGEEAIEGSHLLVATGRKPNTDGLDLEVAGIKNERHGIVVDKGLRTTNKKVYAIGDVTGGLQFTHVANYQAGLVVRNALFRLPVKANNDLVPWVTYTDPELAQVGLTEAAAQKRYHRIGVLRWPFHDNDRAQAERQTQGHIKVVTTRRGRILGATIVGPHAGELIATWSLAISQGLNIRAMTSVILPYPTLSEVGKRAAITYFTQSLTSGWVRRLIVWLRRFG